MIQNATAKHHTLKRRKGFIHDIVTPLSGEFIKYVLQQQYMPRPGEFPTISEKELKIAYANNAIKVIQVMRIESGSYRMVVTAKIYDKTEDYLLITVRKTPKEFVSLERLLKYIEDTYGVPQQFSLALRFSK